MNEHCAKTAEDALLADRLPASQSVVSISNRTGLSRPTATKLSETPNLSEKFLRDVVEACASSIAMLDETGAIRYASRAWRRFEQKWLFSRERNLPHYFMFFRREPENPSRIRPAESTLADDVKKLLANEVTEIQGRYSYAGRPGSLSLLVHSARLDIPGSPLRVLISHDDVDPKEALRKSEQRLSQLLETTKIVAWEADPETWRFTYVSTQARELLGYPIIAWYAPDFLRSNIYPEDLQSVLRTFREQLRSNDSFEVTFRILASDGRLVWIHNLVSVTRCGNRTVGVHGFMIDITEQRRIQEVLRDLGSRLIAAQEEERSRVARELHDDLNQRMALLSIELEQLETDRQSPLVLHEHVQRLQEHVEEIAADIHRLSYRLHPSKLDHLGLAPAVESLCRELSSDQLTIHSEQSGFPADLPQDVTLCLFRIAQEALRNCVKHSQAEVAVVTLDRLDDEVRLVVSDDGCGFDMESDAMQHGLGFTSMRERLRLLNGRIEIRSQPMHGTTIKVSIPLTC